MEPNAFIGLIILFPLLGAILNGFAGRHFSKPTIGLIGCGSIFLSFLVGLYALALSQMTPDQYLNIKFLTWIQLDPFTVDFGLLFDSLSATMVMVVTFIGFLIHVYSIGYMNNDPNYSRYFAYLNLFVAAMLILVLADNLLVMFIGWEGVGLCSYLLIGFWYEVDANASAGRKAFITNRVGDFGFILGILTILYALGYQHGIYSLDFLVFEQTIHEIIGDTMFGIPVIEIIGVLLFLGACGKSAQLPLHVWLPDAMAGPTPVSALIHAATMVTAGVFMIARMNALYNYTQVATDLIAIVGALTALMAATIALKQYDIKKILAYSTISQLGFMFLAMGCKAYDSGIFHIVTHACFKALLFLGAGSVIRALHHEQDIRKMGGLRKNLRWTYAVFLIATLAISGVPLLSGFFSKDEILFKVWTSGHYGLYAIGMVTAILTAIYMTRLLYYTFLGTYRGTATQIHESRPIMLAPLVILAILSVVTGGLGIPHASIISDYLSSSIYYVTTHFPLSDEISMSVLCGTVAIAAIVLSLKYYAILQRLEALAPSALSKLFINKYYFDEIYGRFIVSPMNRTASALYRWVDRALIEGFLAGVTQLCNRFFYMLRRIQTGDVQNYSFAIVMGLMVIVIYYVIKQGFHS